MKKILIVALTIIDLALAGVLLFDKSPVNQKNLGARLVEYPEVENLRREKFSFKELSNYFTNLAEKKGAEYAFEVLKVAPIPPGIDMHLMGHVVGDILYKQRGAEGMTVCTQDFRNACSHSIVVGLLLEKGETALSEINMACQKAPGGSGAYTMCYHGLGHGILAYLDYNLKGAINLCKKTSTASENQEFAQCVGGAIMEIIGGGFHNPTAWEKQRKIYLKSSDPLYPCSDDALIPSAAKTFCYLYLTPHLFSSAGADLGNPLPEHFKKAFRYCDAIAEPHYRRSCYGGFGKEFIVIAKNRDIRNISGMKTDEMKKVLEWCALGKSEEAVLACLNSAASSMYWGGENDRSTVIRFCGLIPETNFRDSCFENLIGAVGYYVGDQSYRDGFCGELPESYQKACRERLLK